jgi:hypothetical protein
MNVHSVSAMAKLKTDPITSADLATFAANDSDFAFELRVLHQLRGLGFQCEHSGTYEDPVTGKFRQFDIRANKNLGKVHLALAVECKNIRPYHPLLVSAVPRTQAEAFHDRIDFTSVPNGGPSQCIRLVGRESAYPVGESVGKKTDQVGRENMPDAGLVSDDSATFEKLNQAVNSCRDLVRYCGSTSQTPYLRVVAPVLVVPDGVLWQVDYTANGTMTKKPRVIPATTLFLGLSWDFDRGDRLQIPYGMSHLEIWTPAGLDGRSAMLSNLLL